MGRQNPPAGTIQVFLQEHPLQQNEKTVINPPDQKRPGRSVPDPGRQKYDDQIHIRPDIAAPVPAQRNVKIFLEPRRQGYVPPRPWKRMKAGGKGDDRGLDGWMASPTQWT